MFELNKTKIKEVFTSKMALVFGKGPNLNKFSGFIPLQVTY